MEKVTRIISMCDPNTQDHQKRVSVFSVLIAQQMGLPSYQVDNIKTIGLIHDIGKVILPPNFMEKTGSLDAIERIIVRDHPQAGFDMLECSGLSDIIKQSVLQHHERIDGSGYPKGLKGNEIRLEAKVVSVADVVDAMTSHRPYNMTLELSDALEEISKNRGIYYDETVVDACFRTISDLMQTLGVATAINGFFDQQSIRC